MKNWELSKKPTSKSIILRIINFVFQYFNTPEITLPSRYETITKSKIPSHSSIHNLSWQLDATIAGLDVWENQKFSGSEHRFAILSRQNVLTLFWERTTSVKLFNELNFQFGVFQPIYLSRNFHMGESGFLWNSTLRDAKRGTTGALGSWRERTRIIKEEEEVAKFATLCQSVLAPEQLGKFELPQCGINLP
jgi:hypothetical protein